MEISIGKTVISIERKLGLHDVVKVKRSGSIGVIVAVDQDDKVMPFKLYIKGEGIDWEGQAHLSYVRHLKVNPPPADGFKVGDIVRRVGGDEEMPISEIYNLDSDEPYKVVFKKDWNCGSWYAGSEIEFVSRPQ